MPLLGQEILHHTNGTGGGGAFLGCLADDGPLNAKRATLDLISWLTAS